MDNLELLKNLMIMAAADGRLTREEIAFLSHRSARWGFDEEQFRATLDFATDPDSAVTIPDTRDERLLLLSEMVRMMGADGEVDEREKALFASVATRMEITDEELNEVIDRLT